VAADLDLGGLRDDLDQLLRAGFCTGAAARAVVASHDRYAVDNADRVKFTGCHAVAQTDAAVRAGLAAAEELLGRFTGTDIFIFIELGSVVSRAVAHDERNLFLHAAGVLTEQGSQLLGDRRAAYGTLGAGRISAFCHRVRIVITARKSAAAAVCSGELRTQIEKELILLDCENLGRIAEHTGSEETDDDDKYYRYYYIHPLSPFL
jgi:hypothetical protein